MKSQVTLLLLIAAIIFAHAYGKSNDTVKPVSEKLAEPLALTTLMVGKKAIVSVTSASPDTILNSRMHAFIPVN